MEKRTVIQLVCILAVAFIHQLSGASELKEASEGF